MFTDDEFEPDLENVTHLDQNALEDYVLRRLNDEQVEQVREHLIVCGFCREQADRHGRSADIDADAAARQTPLFLHETEDGQLTAYVFQGWKGWVARIVGPTLDCMGHGRTEEEARTWCAVSFAEMFPEHQCSPDHPHPACAQVRER